MRFLDYIYYCISIILDPRMWLMLFPYSRTWDNWVNKSLDEGKFTDIGEYTARLNGELIWIANYPYGFGTPHNGLHVRPSRMTIRRIMRRIIEDRYAQ